MNHRARDALGLTRLGPASRAGRWREPHGLTTFGLGTGVGKRTHLLDGAPFGPEGVRVTRSNTRPRSASADAARERELLRLTRLSVLERIEKALELGRRGREVREMAKQATPEKVP